MAALAAAVFADANGARPGNQPLAANSAVLVRSTNTAIAGIYLLINLSGFTGTLPGLGGIASATLVV